MWERQVFNPIVVKASEVVLAVILLVLGFWFIAATMAVIVLGV